jgi:AcrR family transcriptional regulator
MAKPSVRRARLTRDERKLQTRADLLRTARRLFEERGFHGASLEDIADEAGYTKGAVYSNFASKDELFLAVLGEHIERRVRASVEVALEAADFASGTRAVARSAVAESEREPAWAPLVVEFWAHASRREELRRAVLALHERQLDAFTGLIEELARRHDVTFRVAPREVVRGTGALGRGLALERLLEPDAALGDLFEELFVAATLGVTESAR